MSNDVHLIKTKVTKVQRTAIDNSKGIEMVHNRRCLEKNIKGPPDIRHSEEEYLFGSISPRGGSGIGIGHTPLVGLDVDSPDHTQRDTNESDNNISSCSTLDIVNKVEHLSIQQLENQVRELSQRLNHSEDQRNEMKRQLEECKNEKELCFRRLEVVSAAHECRITEMHCVIAELSKKLRAKQENTIMEEQEPDGSEISYQEGSIYNSELNLTNPDAECQTDPLDAAEYSNGDGFGCNGEENLCIELTADDLKLNDAVNKGKVEALQEEVLHLKSQIALLQSEIANSLRLDPNAVVEEKQSIEYYEADAEANDSNCSIEHLHFEHNHKRQLNDLNSIPTDFMAPLKHCDALTSPQKASLVPRMAERVKLHCASKTHDNITATDLISNEIKNSDIVEHLVSDLKQDNSMMQCFVEPSDVDSEIQRLQRKIENHKMHNTVLLLTLDECKEHCEHLYLLCGKYESNAIALQTAVNCSDRAIEAYDVMLALLESKLALINDKSAASEDSRKAVESVARHLLDRLESEKDTCENSLGPWQNTFSIPDKATMPWTSDDDNRLRYHVSKLKGRRSTVQNTIVNLESPFSDFYEKSRIAIENGVEIEKIERSKELDLETAVLMHELLNLREENIELRQKVKESEKTQLQAIEKIRILQEALKPLQLQLAADSNVLFQENAREHRVSYSEAEHIALTEQQLIEALTRESELKGRIQTLIATVSASQKITDEKYEQLHNNIKELQKSNLSLSQLVDQNKRKYQSRIRKLEQKIMDMNVEGGRQHYGSDNSVQVQQFQRLKCKMAITKSLPHDNVPETTL